MKTLKLLKMRTVCRIGLAVAWMGVVSGYALAETGTLSSDERQSFNIPAQDLSSALQEVAAASHYKLLYKTALVAGKRSGEVRGEFTGSEAIARALAGTELRFEITDEAVVLIKGVGERTGLVAKGGVVREAEGQGVAQAQQEGAKEEVPKLEEIVVTAQKKVERLQDVPIPVTVLSTDALADNNQTKIQDYYTQVPGLAFSPNLFGTQNLAIRGITTGGLGSGQTVGLMIDDVPYMDGSVAPDLDPGDLSRIEVLRGPQGTLYGTSSMGGLVKFVTREPSTAGASARVEAGTNTVQNGYSLGYITRASGNLPITDDLAIRASGFIRQDPGYLDNPVLNIEGINQSHASGGHFALLWKPTETFSARASALFQDLRSPSTNDITTQDFNGLPVTGDLRQAYIRNGQFYDRRTQAYGLVLTDKIGRADVTSVTGYHVLTGNNSLDATTVLGSTTGSNVPGFFPGFYGSPSLQGIGIPNFSDELSQEIRVSTPLSAHLEGLFGVFYRYSLGRSSQILAATDPYTGAVAGYTGIGNYGESRTTEDAVFADVTYHVTSQMDVQIGGRESYSRGLHTEQISTGPLFGNPPGPPSITPESHAKSPAAFTYLFSPQYKISHDLMVYARLASGFRPGGVNVGLGLPPTFDPDKTKNYEIGFKGDILDHKLFIDTSVYYIDWAGLQTVLTFKCNDNCPSNNQTYTANAGGAKSEGVELAMEWRPGAGLKLAGWVAFNEAVLTTVPANISPADTYAVGDRLPYAARFSGNLSVDQEFHPIRGAQPFVGLTVSYQGNREDVFNTGAPRQYLPPYARTDLRGGVRFDSWNVNLYANNVMNRRGLVSGGAGNSFPFSFYYMQPRTIGLSASRSF